MSNPEGEPKQGGEADLRTILQEYQMNTTTFWNRKMEEWKQERQSDHAAFEKRIDELERTISCLSFNQAVRGDQHSSPNIRPGGAQTSEKAISGRSVPQETNLQSQDMELTGLRCAPPHTEREVGSGKTATTALSLRAELPCAVQPYDGTGSWSDYQRQFEIAARYARWTLQEKAAVLAMQLRGEALTVLSALPTNAEPDYDLLVNLLSQRFCPDSRSSYTQLRNRMQGPKESLAEFALSLQRLAVSALPDCPKKVVQELMISQFIDGLRDDSIQNLVTVSQPTSLSQALNLAHALTARTNRRCGNVFMADEPRSSGRQSTSYQKN